MGSKKTVWAVVPAGGVGRRFVAAEKGEADKLMVSLAGLPVLVRTIQALMAAKNIDGVMIAAHKDHQPKYEALLTDYTFSRPFLFTEGGDTRRDSVMNGVKALPEDVGVVVVHDAARPLIEPDIIDGAIEKVLTGSCSGVVVSVPIWDTVKRSSSNGAIEETVNRDCLWRAQTPQVFNKMDLVKAHQAVAADTHVTDDAQLLELAGMGKVAVFEGSESNIKITVADDLLLAERILIQADTNIGA